MSDTYCLMKRAGPVVALLVLAIAAVATVAHAQTFSVLYNFGSKSGDPWDSVYPGVIAQGRDGNLYSTSESGGANGYGAMFKITPGGALTVPYSFDSTDEYPQSGLTLGTDGNFYGATLQGSSSYCSGGCGTIFKITPSGTVTLLHSFAGSDGSQPYAPPIQGTDGNFYGTTSGGGASRLCGNGCGTVYKITPSGTFTTLYSFDVTHGSYPIAALVQGTNGYFYGTTSGGGTYNYGVVYKITVSGKLTVIYNFDYTHGGQPVSPLVQGNDGNFYGTTTNFGRIGQGTVFKITPTGKLTLLHNFSGYTFAGLVQATDGNFYGATYRDGATSQGTIFRISPTKPYPYKVLYNFDGSTGSYPLVTLFQHTNGILYGDTKQGGTGNVNPCTVGLCGVFYSLNIGVGPFVSLVSTSGKVGKTVEILGQGFKGTTGVSFNGTAATIFKAVSDTYLTATVPSGATTGSVNRDDAGRPVDEQQAIPGNSFHPPFQPD